MKKFLTVFSVVLFSIILIVSNGITGESPKTDTEKKEGINWISLDEALPLAKEKKKHVFIDFTTDWCKFCKKMDKEVFTQQAVIDLLNNDFIPVKVHGDKQNVLEIDGYKISEKDLAQREFKVKGYPTYWFLTPDGAKLTNFSGYKPADYMTAALTYIKDYEYDSTKTKDGTLKENTESSN